MGSSAKIGSATGTGTKTTETRLEISGADISAMIIKSLRLPLGKSFVSYTFEGDFTLIAATVRTVEFEGEVRLPLPPETP
jgi:hypothetical protein